uniref:uncharacterized protein LOC122610923 n=1 Tax=Erigeron canadensis TaxID=72917 RepID=UPI001CB9558B|nr:uncharacterized protein LOC122610923 [Erigeron canadensis]
MALPCADMECQLQVHADCESCMMRSYDTIRSIRGVYEVEWNRRENIFKISGEVDPSVLMKAALRSGEHATLIDVKLKHPHTRNNFYRSYGPTVGNYMPPYRDAYRSSLHSMPYYETNDRYYPYGMSYGPAARMDYGPPYNTTYYDHQYPLPPATHVPSLPYQEYNDPYHNYAAVDPCSIM